MPAIAAVVSTSPVSCRTHPCTSSRATSASLVLEPTRSTVWSSRPGEQGAWARLERGELTIQSFCAPFEADCRAQGIEVDAPAPQWRRSPRRASHAAHCSKRSGESARTAAGRRPHEQLGDRRAGIRIARQRHDALTPRPATSTSSSNRRWSASQARSAIYTLVCEKLGVPPACVAFLDDIGRKPQAGAGARDGDDQRSTTRIRPAELGRCSSSTSLLSAELDFPTRTAVRSEGARRADRERRADRDDPVGGRPVV